MYTKTKLSQRKPGLIFLIFLCPSFLSSCGYVENDSYVHTNHYADYESWASDIIYQREKHGTETDPLLTFDPSELNPRSYPHAEYSITGVGWAHAKKYKDPGASYMSDWESLGVFNYCCIGFYEDEAWSRGVVYCFQWLEEGTSVSGLTLDTNEYYVHTPFTPTLAHDVEKPIASDCLLNEEGDAVLSFWLCGSPDVTGEEILSSVQSAAAEGKYSFIG